MEWTKEYPKESGYYWVYNKQTAHKTIEYFYKKGTATDAYKTVEDFYSYYIDTYRFYGPIEAPEGPYQVEYWFPKDPDAYKVIKVPKAITKEFIAFVSNKLQKGHISSHCDEPDKFYIVDEFEDTYDESPLNPNDYIVEMPDGYIYVYDEESFMDNFKEEE